MSTELQKLGELYESRNEHEIRMSKIEYQINGNGDPSMGLMARMKCIEDWRGTVVDKDDMNKLLEENRQETIQGVKEALRRKWNVVDFLKAFGPAVAALAAVIVAIAGVIK